MSSGGSSNREIDYRCTVCGNAVDPALITVKRVQFTTVKGRALRTRTTDWLCPDCCDADPVWQMPARSGSPGMRDTKMAAADG